MIDYFDKGERESHPLLVKVRTFTATIEFCVMVSSEARNKYTSKSFYITLGYMTKRLHPTTFFYYLVTYVNCLSYS